MHITTAKLQIRFRLIAICYLSSCIFYYPQLLSVFSRTSTFRFWHQNRSRFSRLENSWNYMRISRWTNAYKKTHLSLKSPVMNFLLKTTMLLLRKPSVRKRKEDTRSTEKQSKTIRQGSPGQHRMKIIPLLKI